MKSCQKYGLLLQSVLGELYILHSDGIHKQIVDSVQVLAVEKADLNLAPALL